MKRFLLDTGIAGDYMNRRLGVYDRARVERASGNVVGTAVPAVAELAYGFELSVTRDRNMRALQVALASWRLWPFDLAAAHEYGRPAAHLRQTGRPMQVFDIMIAAIALTLGNCTVVTGDTDFAAVPGLVVEDWRV